jgi:diguanylate cyclase
LKPWQAQWADLLFGQDARLRIRTRLSFVAGMIYLSWAGMFALALQAQWMAVNVDASTMVLIPLLAGLTYYPLVRSGLTARFSDPALVLPQMITAYCVCAYAYVVAPDTRGSVLQAMCLIQVFGLISLSPREVAQAGAASVASVAAAWAGGSLWAAPGNFSSSDEGPSLLMSAFILALLALVSYNYSRMRARVRKQKQVLIKAVQQVEHIISHDPLTGLYNRRHMVDVITREVARAERSGLGMALVLIDLDHFKQINDDHGHQVGDEVLQAFADVAQGAIRDTDTMGRWGGEEFIILLPDTQPAERAMVVVNRIQAILRNAVVSQRQPRLRLSFSGGVVVPRSNETLDVMIDRADKALYAAKAQGRQRTLMAD